MESHKQSTIAYALGFIEDYVENNTEPLEDVSADENAHREQVQAAMAVLSAGVKQLMHENAALLNKIVLADLALKG